jgi:hypothetical protein
LISIGYTDLGNSLTASGTITVTVGNTASGRNAVVSSPTTSTPDDDTNTQWAGFSAAVELLNS